ncbi:hypothetical protein ORF12 [Crane-associated adenovirus 1]|uniref:Uncharacterized protein n=1 Tax=Crane-associated adenovirus 1 TaxID=2559941 RepID=A0A5H2WT44_9ADEN|nr:hypothetical protein ORF12 [Crane-associated adenovirus 1]
MAMNRNEQTEEIVRLLEKLRIFTAKDWFGFNPDMFNKWVSIAEGLLKQARIKYCKYTVYQSFISGFSLDSMYSLRSRALKEICDFNGLNLACVASVLGRWMWEWSISGYQNTINTLYIVGDNTTDAEILCYSIVRSFHCVLTVDENLDTKELFKIQDQTKFLYFPSVGNTALFNKAHINQLLRGRDFNIITTESKLGVITPLKCLVHLNKLPETFPTSPDQHAVIHLTEPSLGKVPTEPELRFCVSNLYSDDTFRCTNPYGVICSSLQTDSVCSSCDKCYINILHYSPD